VSELFFSKKYMLVFSNFVLCQARGYIRLVLLGTFIYLFIYLLFLYNYYFYYYSINYNRG